MNFLLIWNPEPSALSVSFFVSRVEQPFNHSHQLKMQMSVTAEVVNLRNTLAIYGNMTCVLTSESVDEDVEQLMQPLSSSLLAAVIALQYFAESLTCRTGLFLRLSGEKRPARNCLTLHACFVPRSPKEREKIALVLQATES